MTAPANRWKLGLFVVAGTTIGLGGIAFLGARELHRASHIAYAYFDEAVTGLEEGSPVKFRGVTIGVVDRIRVAPDKKHLEVQASLYDDYLRELGLDVGRLEGGMPLPANLRAQIVMSWVTSTAFVQVDYLPDPPSGPQQLPFEVKAPLHTLRTVPSTAKSLESAAREVLSELPLVGVAIRELVELVRSDLAAMRLPEVSRRLHALLLAAEKQFTALDEQGTVAAATRALDEVASTATALRDDRAPLATTLREWAELGRSLRAEIEAARLGDTSEAVRGATAGITAASADLRIELQQFGRTLAAIERLAELLERDPGALLHGRAATTSRLKENR